MKVLWHVQSRFYHASRSIPGLTFLLNREKENCRNLLPEFIEDLPCILDIGTGSGSSLDIFPQNISIIAVDQSLAMLKQAAKRRRHMMPVVADIKALPFKTGSLSFCSCIGVMEYLSPANTFLSEIYRVISMTGSLLITGSNHSFWNYFRYLLGHRLYLRSADQWTQLFRQAHFDSLDMQSSLIQHQWHLKKTIKITTKTQK